MIRRLLFILLIAAVSFSVVQAQFQNKGLSGGIGFGGILGNTDLNAKLRAEARGFLRYGFADRLQAECGLGIGRIGGDDYNTLIIPIDLRLVYSPFTLEGWNPYLYAGYGFIKYRLDDEPPVKARGAKTDDWAGYLPVGAGVQFPLNEKALVEFTGGYNISSSDDLDATRKDSKRDAFWNFMVNFTLVGESGEADPDKDGLTNDQEKQLGTDKKNPDTDRDGLTDGEEVNMYHTNPLVADSDGDGLSDADEVKKYNTDPNKKDTDGDGLSDADELMKYHTDPLKADTDGDGLKDGEEILNQKTNPLKADTDGDGLTDGDEVAKYKTSPLKADTDGGTVDDGTEVKNGTDPLNPADDVKKEEPKPEVLKVEKGASIVLEGIVFKTNSADVTPESQDILTKVYNTMIGNPELEVEIQGYTDNVGKRTVNVRLSQRRADAVKAYIVGKGIEGKRITTKGFGPDRPIAPNTTEESKQKNRRIEFFRTK